MADVPHGGSPDPAPTSAAPASPAPDPAAAAEPGPDGTVATVAETSVEPAAPPAAPGRRSRMPRWLPLTLVIIFIAALLLPFPKGRDRR